MADGFITTPSYMAPDFTSFFTWLPAPGWGVGLIACCYKPKLQGDRLLVEFYFWGGVAKQHPQRFLRAVLNRDPTGLPWASHWGALVWFKEPCFLTQGFRATGHPVKLGLFI